MKIIFIYQKYFMCIFKFASKKSGIISFLFFLLLSANVSTQEYWSREHVFYGKGGILTYTPDEQGNIIPDFSQVGYRYGDEPIPDIETVIEVSPVEGDDGATIQAAIATLYTVEPDEKGFRGAVLLKSGEYQVEGQIKIGASGIVLRGEGNSDTGTVIVAEGTSDRDLIKIDKSASRSVVSSSRVSVTEDYVPVGRKYVVVSNTTNYAEGDHIVLYRPGTSRWISDIKMDQITQSEGTKQWSPSSYSFYFERQVTKINDDTLFFRNPVVMAMDKTYGGGAVYKYSFNRLQNIGVENLYLKSAYKSDTDENHSWNAINIANTENGWVRNVTSWYFAFACVNLEKTSKFITVNNCHCREPKSVITGGRRYSFNVNGSMCLVQNCSTTEGRHDYATGSRVCGPNVFTRCTATNVHADIGPHHRWAMGSLYDMIETDGAINVQDRDDMGTGHGWAGANQVFWNCEGESSICQSPWASAKNYNFGFIGKKGSGARPGRPDGEWVGHNVPGIFPVSLYEAQLDERLNGTILFSAIPQLTQINDTSYLMQFTLPINPEQIVGDNFDVTGITDLNEGEFSVIQNDEYSVIVSSAKLKDLPDLTTVVVKSKNLTSIDNIPLQGVTAASFKTSDKRPVVTGAAKIVDNIDGMVEASSDKTGFIYLVKYGINASTQAELDSLVQGNMGRKTEYSIANEDILIYTKGLPDGYYQYYAVDEDQRVSLPSSYWVIVEEKGPVSGLNQAISKNSFSVYYSNGLLVVEPENNERYSLEIFSITGKLFYKEKHLSGKQNVDIFNQKGIMIVRKSTGIKTEILKIVLQ